ncbi:MULTISPECIES: endonuclease V [Methanobacterium]|jgi:deoxyribonuclease V|uniref:Endonuclease V n=1 Tax=Methanobacterium veterum TaxID=408577 RepID=A0A9E4ZYH5_9EURY|nr:MULTISPECIES: endonuclease V [Methanobacterium]MCZ3365793.1 endonuclease V [Methanobacterium veterum]MCZ3371257.1 endonuclease V [Methanobacterium veterum]
MCSYNFPQKLADIQYSLSKNIIEQDSFKNVHTVAGADISFEKDDCAVAAAVVVDLDDLTVIDSKAIEVKLLFPYISGFLGFREANAVISVLRKLNNEFDVLMVNGHGIMHPRGFGLASHVGLLMDMPTIGVAKRLIKGNYKYKSDNSLKTVEFMNKSVGACNRQKCISVGHKISLKTAVDIVRETSIFKMPEPLRQAHILATNTMKDKIK